MEGEVCRQSAAIRSEWVWEERAALIAYSGADASGRSLSIAPSGAFIKPPALRLVYDFEFYF